MSNTKRRSICPISIALELFGDRWSLLVVRDMMVRGLRTFKEFQEAGEGIATNILADRLDKLREAGILAAEADPGDARRVIYRLTEKGIDLAPVLLEMMLWSARHEDTIVPCALAEALRGRREYVLAEVRRRWAERDPAPLLQELLSQAPGGSRQEGNGNEDRSAKGTRVARKTRR